MAKAKKKVQKVTAVPFAPPAPAPAGTATATPSPLPAGRRRRGKNRPVIIDGTQSAPLRARRGRRVVSGDPGARVRRGRGRGRGGRAVDRDLTRTTDSFDAANARRQVMAWLNAAASTRDRKKRRKLRNRIDGLMNALRTQGKLTPELERELVGAITAVFPERGADTPTEPEPGTPTNPETGGPVVEAPTDELPTEVPTDTTTDPSVDLPGLPEGIPPELASLIGKMSEIEDVLRLDKGKGKKRFKQVWKNVKFVFGNELSAKGKSTIATENARVAQGRSRQATDEAVASFGKRSPNVGPGAKAAFQRAQFAEEGAFIQKGGKKAKLLGPGATYFGKKARLRFGADGQLLDEYGNPVAPGDVPLDENGLPIDPALDPGLVPDGADQSIDPNQGPIDASSGGGGYGPVVDESDLFNNEGDLEYGREVDSIPVPGTEYDMPVYNDGPLFSLPQDPGFEDDYGTVPIGAEDEAFTPGGSEATLDATQLEAMSNGELLDESFGPTVDSAEYPSDYNDPSLHGGNISDVDAVEGMALIEEGLGDLSKLLRKRLVPAFNTLVSEAKRSRDPELLARAKAAQFALNQAREAYQRGISDCRAVRERGIGVIPLMIAAAPTAAQWMGIGVAAALSAVGIGVAVSAKDATEGIGTGMKIAIPAAAILFVLLMAK